MFISPGVVSERHTRSRRQAHALWASSASGAAPPMPAVGEQRVLSESKGSGCVPVKLSRRRGHHRSRPSAQAIHLVRHHQNVLDRAAGDRCKARCAAFEG